MDEQFIGRTVRFGGQAALATSRASLALDGFSYDPTSIETAEAAAFDFFPVLLMARLRVEFQESAWLPDMAVVRFFARLLAKRKR